jgi:hypothetical protein
MKIFISLASKLMTQDSSVCTVQNLTIYRLEDWGLIPGRLRDFIFITMSRLTGAHLVFYIIGTWGYFLGDKAARVSN